MSAVGLARARTSDHRGFPDAGTCTARLRRREGEVSMCVV